MKDLFTLKDKVIVVTGAGGLLGFEYCKAILNANGIPILIDINEKLLKSKVAELKDEFPTCICNSYVVDITKEEQRLILIEKDYQRDLDYSKDNKNCQNTSIRLINQKISYICLNKNKGNVIKSLPEFTYKLNDHNLIIK